MSRRELRSLRPPTGTGKLFREVEETVAYAQKRIDLIDAKINPLRAEIAILAEQMEAISTARAASAARSMHHMALYNKVAVVRERIRELMPERNEWEKRRVTYEGVASATKD